MKKFYYIAAGMITIFLLANCSGDYRQKAVGPRSRVTVIMDSTMWHSRTADAIRKVYGQDVETVPRPYPLFDVSFRDFKTQKQLNTLLKYENLIIAAPLGGQGNTAVYLRSLLGDSLKNAIKQGQYFAIPLKDKWYRNQWTMILTSTADSVLAQKIMSNQEFLLSGLLKRTFQRYEQLVYSAGEQTKVENKLWSKHGWKVRVPPSWKIHIDTTYAQKNGAHTGFVTFRNNIPQNIRWFWIWWTNKPPSEDALSPKWINQTRDSLLEKYIRGTRDSSYVTTDNKNFPVITDTLKVNGNPAYETRGVWRMTHGAMGGPFVNMTIRDQQNGRLFLLGIGQYAPKFRNKRRFVRRFRAILRTFQSDSTWSGQKKTASD
jgi:hypothetical protein